MKTRINVFRLLVGFLLVSAVSARGNAVSITNISIVNVEDGCADIQFDLTWSNGWNLSWSEDGGATTITNRDAVWVFVKYRVGPSEWRHAWLAPTGHLATGGTTIEVGSNGGDTNVGAFVYLSNTAVGTVSCPGMRLKWAFIKNGLAGTNSVDISVHGIEMVYIPEGSFALGSGGNEGAHFFIHPITDMPYTVTSEAEIPVGATNGYLRYVSYWFGSSDEIGGSVTRGGDGLGPIPAACPKGFNAIYCMKYEVSQEQYATFLNHAGGYASTYFPNVWTSRFAICFTNGSYVAMAPDRACNYLSWADLAAYLDWAGLRPMTELEFEKVCRGPLSAVSNEYVRGDTSLTRMTNHLGVDGSGDETALPVNANANYGSGIAGPVRVGIFATTNSTRYTAGAGYYGVLNLADNVFEIVVSVGAPDGRAFTPQHGDGELAARPSTWPGPASAGMGVRGGSWQSAASKLRTSSREGIYQGTTPVVSRLACVGGRGVRSAP